MRRRGFLQGLTGGLAIPASAARAAEPPSGAGRGQAIDVRGFGAIGDGIADDTAAIQAAIDHALATRQQTVHIPPGRYVTSDTIHLGYGETFSTLALIGAPSYSYGGGMPGAALLPTRHDRPALNIQGARGSLVRGLTIVGRNQQFLDRQLQGHVHVGEPDPAFWLDPQLAGGIDRYRPYAAITIDAYSAPVRADGYPPSPWPSWAKGAMPERRAYSSDVIIDRCWLGGFGVAIAVQPCDADGNGDFVKITNSSISHCVYGIAVGNSQSRNVAIRDCTYVYVHTFLTNRRFGRGIGTLGGSIDNISGGLAYQFLDTTGTYAAALTIKNLYFEAQTRIGAWSVNASFNSPLVFQSCTFHFGGSAIEKSPGPLLECGSQGAVKFLGCIFSEPRRLHHVVTGASFVGLESCNFYAANEYKPRKAGDFPPEHIAKALNYLAGGAFVHAGSLTSACDLTGANIGLEFDLEKRTSSAQTKSRTLQAVAGQRTLVHHFAREFVDRFGRLWQIRARPAPLLIGKRAGSPPIDVLRYLPEGELEIVADPILAAQASVPMAPGDILYDAGGTGIVLALASVRTEGGKLILRATQMTGLSTQGERVRPAIDVPTSGGYLWLYPGSVYLGDAVLFGDFRAGEETVGNVHCGDGGASGIATGVAPGDRLFSGPSGPPIGGGDSPQPYPPATTVLAVDAKSRTVTLDRKAIAAGRFVLASVALT